MTPQHLRNGHGMGGGGVGNIFVYPNIDGFKYIDLKLNVS